MLTYRVPIHTHDEYTDSPASHARIVLDKELIARILKLQKAAKELKVYAILDWDCTPDVLTGDDDDNTEWDGSADGMNLHVTDDDFFWEWYIKHTNTMCSTESISFEELNENLSIFKAKKTDLPRLAVSTELKYESSKVLVEQRLKGE